MTSKAKTTVWVLCILLLACCVTSGCAGSGVPDKEDGLEMLLAELTLGIDAEGLAAIEHYSRTRESADSIPRILNWIDAAAPERDVVGCLLIELVVRSQAPVQFDWDRLLPVLDRRRADSVAAGLAALHASMRSEANPVVSGRLAVQLTRLTTSQRVEIYSVAEACLRLVSRGPDASDPDDWRQWVREEYGLDVDLRGGMFEVVAAVAVERVVEPMDVTLNQVPQPSQGALHASLTSLVDLAGTFQVPAILVIVPSRSGVDVTPLMELGRSLRFREISIQDAPLTIRAPYLVDRGFERELGIHYGPQQDADGRVLDLIRPSTTWNGTTVVWVVSDTWRSSAHAVDRGIGVWAVPLANQGYAVCAVRHRDGPEASFSSMADDIADAMRFVRSRVRIGGKFPRRVVLLGHSAGGHLALLAGLGNEGGASGADAVVAIAAPTDFQSMSEHPLSDRVKALAGPVSSAEDTLLRAARDASPVTRVRRGDPPVLLNHGLADQIVPSNQAERLANVLRLAGVDVELHLVPGHEHVWNGGESYWPTILDWLKRHTQSGR